MHAHGHIYLHLYNDATVQMKLYTCAPAHKHLHAVAAHLLVQQKPAWLRRRGREKLLVNSTHITKYTFTCSCEQTRVCMYLYTLGHRLTHTVGAGDYHWKHMLIHLLCFHSVSIQPLRPESAHLLLLYRFYSIAALQHMFHTMNNDGRHVKSPLLSLCGC